MFYNYFKILNYYIESKDTKKLEKISKINQEFIKTINKIKGGNPEEEIDNSINAINTNIKEVKTIFSEILEKIKNKTDFTADEMNKIKGSIELINKIKSNIGEIKDIKQIRDQLEKINEILLTTISE